MSNFRYLWRSNEWYDGMRWIQFFNERCKNVHDDEWSRWLFLAHDNMMRATEENITENRQFIMTLLSHHFSEISHSLLHVITTEKLTSEKLTYWKLFACWVSNMLTEEWDSALAFLAWFWQQEDEFLYHIVTGDETCVTCYL